ncbi:hypothetical protein [Xylanibacter muris]|uniref:Uncharacterized protein n=1 Tax=Xylanibacter muris TaxID=2736290 RepID=A0ABX2AK97_9BACT|nr:hypothetical protein [Xylanibacter muris]NPD91624.1 hypothetical protein [Xylanibacter muris]
MKKLLTFLVSTLFIIGCGNNDCTTKLSAIDSLITKNMYDSAYMAISDFDTTKIKDKNNKAYYNLLYTQLHFWKDDSWTDSAQIAENLTHYMETDDKEKLARPYYFKGRVPG